MQYSGLFSATIGRRRMFFGVGVIMMSYVVVLLCLAHLLNRMGLINSLAETVTFDVVDAILAFMISLTFGFSCGAGRLVESNKPGLKHMVPDSMSAEETGDTILASLSRTKRIMVYVDIYSNARLALIVLRSKTTVIVTLFCFSLIAGLAVFK